MNYKPSKFNYTVYNYPKNGMALIFNTLQRSLMAVSKEVLGCIESGQLERIPEEIIRYLKSSGIILDKGLIEEDLFDYWLNSYRISKNTLGISLLPTYSCNCKCVYCYANGVKIPIFMEKSVINHFIKWVEKLISLWKPIELDFALHGGEPLLAWNVVEEIINGVKSITESFNLNKNFSIVTNGTLLTQKRIDKLLRYSVNRALFTIDGPPEIHNKRRIYRSGRGTFEIIFNNMVKALNSGMDIVLGVNIDKQNWAYIPVFLDFLVKEGFIERRNFSLIFGMVRQGPTPDNPDHFNKYEANLIECGRIMSKLYREALKRRLRIVEPVGLGICTFKTASHFIVDPLGDIYKCITLTGRKEAHVGSIFQNLETVMQNMIRYLYIEPWKHNDACKNCIYLPLCLGGCAQQALLKYKSLDEVDCIKNYLDEFLPEALKITYERMEIFPELHDHLKKNIKELFGF